VITIVVLVVLLISSLIIIPTSVAPIYADAAFDTTNLSRDGRSQDAVIAASDGNLYVVWVSGDAKNTEIFFARSTDGGITFSNPVNVSNTKGLSVEPQLAVYGNNVYVIWRDETLGRSNILFAKNPGFGAPFSSPVNLSKELEFSQKTYMLEHQVTASGNNVYVVWTVSAGEWTGVFFARSTDRGVSFSNPINVSKNSEGFAQRPQMAVSGNDVYIAWQKGTLHPDARVYTDIYFTVSKNGGLTFSEPVILTSDAAVNTIPQIALSDGNIYLAWFHRLAGQYGTLNSSIFFARSTDQGVSFGNVTKLVENPRLELGIPIMTVSGNNVYVVWRLLDERNNVFSVFFTRSSDGGITFSEPIDLNNIPRGIPEYEIGSQPAIAASGSNVYVVWSDITSERNYEIFLAISTDEGTSFSDPVKLSNNIENFSADAQIAASGSSAYVVWTESIPNAFDVFFSKVSAQKWDMEKLEKAHEIVTQKMIEKDPDLPIFFAGIDPTVPELVIGIDEKAPLPLSVYKERLKQLLGDIPMRVGLGHFEFDALKVVNTTLLKSFDEENEFCCISLDTSPDGNTIAYATSTYNNASMLEYSKLFLHDIRSKTSREVARYNATFIWEMNFSPDGSKLLFLTNGCVHIASLSDGISDSCSELTQVTSADWMPDSSLVVARNVGNETVGNLHHISVYGRDGTERLLYVESSESILHHLRASLDGKKIAFRLDKFYFNELFVLDLESGQVKKVAQNAMQPRWSPDSSFLLYKEIPGRRPPNESFEFEKNNPLGIIKLANVDTNETYTIIRPENSMGFSDFAVSHDGRRLIYALYGYDYSETTPITLPLGIYSAELSQPIPEFPVNLMVIIAIGLTGMLIALHLKRTKTLPYTQQ